MNELTFLGNGAAFNYQTSNTSAYFIENKVLYLIDCGEKIMDKMLAVNLFDDIEKIYVFITHLHSDHIGSLEPMLYYFHYLKNIPMEIFYNKPSNLHRLLVLTGIDFPFEIRKVPDTVEDYQIKTVKQDHIAGSYGFFFFGKRRFFFSGDTSRVNALAIKYLKQGKIDTIYHEVTLSNSRIHTHLNKLIEAVEPKLRSKVYLMHFSNEETKIASFENGFSLSEEIK